MTTTLSVQMICSVRGGEARGGSRVVAFRRGLGKDEA